jgi:DNA replicative helicase MCM subunit Mcm2 (Cdc46/Mcm family)
MDVIMRNDVVESVRAGDKMVFTGSLVVVPDISAVTAPGERLETRFGAAAASAHLRSELHAPQTSMPRLMCPMS